MSILYSRADTKIARKRAMCSANISPSRPPSPPPMGGRHFRKDKPSEM